MAQASSAPTGSASPESRESRKAFRRDVVYGDGDGDGYAQRRVVHRGHEGGDSLGEVVDADSQCGHDAHAHQFAVAGAALHLLGPVGFVRILGRGHQTVDHPDQQHAAEEGQRGVERPLPFAGGGLQQRYENGGFHGDKDSAFAAKSGPC